MNAGPLNARNNSGEIYILFGRETWPAPFDLASIPADVTISGVDPGDLLGSDLDVGDVNGDGIDDILATARFADGPLNLCPSCGDAYVLLGRSTWPSAIDLRGDDDTRSAADVTIFGPDTNDQLGRSCVLGDLNADGAKATSRCPRTTSVSTGKSRSRSTSYGFQTADP